MANTFNTGLATTMTLNGSALIESGSTTSAEIPNSGRGVVRFGWPTITSTTVTFQVQLYPLSGDVAAASFRTLVDKDGDPVSYTIASNTSVEVQELSGIASFKFVMGSAEGSDRTIEVSGRGDNPTANPTKIEASLAGGSVAVTSVIPGTGPTNLGKAEDAVAVTGDTGVASLGVRVDSPAALAAAGDYVWTQMDANGAVWESLATLISGENQTLNRLMTIQSFSSNYISSQTTTTVKSGAGVIGGIDIGSPTATGTVTVYDNTAGSGTVLGVYTAPATPIPVINWLNGVAFATGLTVVTATATNITTVKYV